MLSRRDFLLASTSVMAMQAIEPAHAWIHGSGGHPASVLNANFSTDQYLNLAKSYTFGFTGTMTPANLNADQYPSGTIPSAYIGNPIAPGFDPTYFGHFIATWTGVSSMLVSFGIPSIIYAGGTFAGLAGSTGTIQGDIGIGTTANPSVEFAPGCFITAVGTSGGLVQFSVNTNFWGNTPNGAHVKINNVTGLPAGPNSDGSWTTNKIDNQTFTLAGSGAFAGSVSINTSGTVGVNTEVIVNQTGCTLHFVGNGVINHTLSNFIFCKSADLTAINAGKQITAAAISAIKSIKPRYIRFMDVQAVQGLFANYANKAPSTSMTWSGTRWDPTCYVGATTNSGDAYTCSNPSASPSTGAPIDGETVQVTFNASNTTTKPTLTISRTGYGSAVPIIENDMRNLWLTMSGSTTTGDVLTFVFSNSFFGGGTHTFTYTVLAGDTTINILGASLQAAMAADLAMSPIMNFQNAGNGLVSAYCATPTTATFSASGSATELCSPGTQVVPATSNYLGTGNPYGCLSGSSGTLIYNGVMQAWVLVSNGSTGIVSGVPLEYMYEMCTRSGAGAWFCLNMISTSAAASSFGAAMATNLGGLPVICELSNEVWNFGSQPVFYASAMAMCTGLGPDYGSFYGLRTAQLLPSFASGYTGAGGSRGLLELITADVVIEGSGGYTGQMVPARWDGAALAPSPLAVTGSITTTTLTLTLSGDQLIVPRVGFQVTGSGVTAGTVITKILTNTTFQVNNSQSVGSTTITLTNPQYSTKSGVGGASSSTAYNAFPTRPIDLMDGTSYATYIEGALAGDGAASWSGTQSFYNTMFQASKDYASGIPANMASAIQAVSNDIRQGTKNGIAWSNGMSSFLGVTNATQGNNFIPGWEAKLQVYDGARPVGKSNLTVRCYEGMIPQQATSYNGVAGINGSSDLATQFNGNTVALFNGVGSGTNITISNVSGGSIVVGSPIFDTTSNTIPANTTIVSQTSGTPGGAGVYVTSNATTSTGTQVLATGWLLSPTYGASNAVVAANIVTLLTAYRNDPQYAVDQLYFWNQQKSIHSPRPFSPAQYGIENGIGGSTWALYPGTLSSTPWQNLTGQAQYNAQ